MFSDQTGKSVKVKVSMAYRTEMFGATLSARCWSSRGNFCLHL